MRDFTRRCEQCGAEIEPMAHPRRTFCSRKCCNDHFNGLAKEALAEARAGRVCPECGGTFNATRADQVFCCKECQRASTARRKREVRQRDNPTPPRQPRSCEHCGGDFTGRMRRFCGRRCATKARWKAGIMTLPPRARAVYARRRFK